MGLYELASEYRKLSDLLDSEEGLEHLHEALAGIEAEAGVKLDNCARWIANLEAEEEALKEEMKRLQAKARAKANRVEGLRAYMLDFMRRSGFQKFDTGIRKLSIRPGSVSLTVNVDEIRNWPADVFDRAIEIGAITEKIDVTKTLLKQIPGFEQLPGVAEVRGDETLVIR